MNKQFPLPHIVSPIAPDLRRFLDRVKESFDDPNGLVTKQDLIGTGVFKANTASDLEFLEPGEEISYATPPAPLNLVAAGAMTAIILTWSGVNYNAGYAYTEVWRASANNLGLAVLIGTATAGMYADAVGSAASHWYWVRMVNVLNDKGPFNSVAGTAGATSPDVDYLLSQLTNSLTNSQLHQSLTSSINSTFHQDDAPTNKKDGTPLVAGDIWIDSNNADSVHLYNGVAWGASGVATQAYVGTEITQQVGYCERTITATGVKNVATAHTTKALCTAASVSGESFAWQDDTALAGEVKTVTTTATGNTAAATAAQNTANTASSAATAATLKLTNIASDSVITPVEKLQAKTLWDAVVAEKAGIIASATNAGIATSATVYEAYFKASTGAYQLLDTYLNTTIAVFGTMTSDTTGVSRSTWDSKWSGYYGAKQALLDAIAAALKALSVANTASIQVQTDSIDGIEAKHTVKIDNNGYVTGYGLISTANNGTPTSEFAIVADQFSIAPVNTSNTATDGSPFFHRTSATTINGVSIPAGTYMKGAFIHDATITNAKIGNLAVDAAKIANATIVNAKIADATIETAKIKDANITTAKIGTAAITTAKIADGNITNAKIGNTIQSAAYVSGSAGWKIDKSGAMEMNNATFRGTLDVTSSASGSRLEIDGDTIKVYEGSTLRVKLGNLA